MNVDVTQHLFPAAMLIREADMVEVNAPVPHLGFRPVGAVHIRLFIQNFCNTPAAGGAHGNHHKYHREHHQRHEHAHDIAEQRSQISCG